MIKAEKKTTVDLLIVPMDSSALKFSINAAKTLRDSGVPTDVYYLDKGFKQKMKYANKIGVPFITIVGESEMAENKITLKNMTDGSQNLVRIEDAASIVKNSENN